MLKTSFAAVFACILLCPSTRGAELTRPQPARPDAVLEAGEGSYCFARDRHLRPDLNPPPKLVLSLRLKVTYKNPGERPMIIPVEHVRAVYTSLAPGVMKPFKETIDLFGTPAVKMMKNLPPDVSIDSPVDPANDTFAVIPAGGNMRPLEEDVVIPLYKKGLHQTDLRGHRLYLRLQLTHQELAGDLEALLSDKVGALWRALDRNSQNEYACVRYPRSASSRRMRR